MRSWLRKWILGEVIKEAGGLTKYIEKITRDKLRNIIDSIIRSDTHWRYENFPIVSLIQEEIRREIKREIKESAESKLDKMITDKIDILGIREEEFLDSIVKRLQDKQLK